MTPEIQKAVAESLIEAERRGYILPDRIFAAPVLEQLDLLLRVIATQGAVPCPDTGGLWRIDGGDREA